MAKKKMTMLALPMVLLSACAEFIEVDTPKNEITGESVYKDDATATAAVVGIYAKMSEIPYFNNVAIPRLTGLCADEFISNGLPVGPQYEQNEISSREASLVEMLWQPGYKYIYQANAILEGLETRDGTVSDAVRQSVRGQAYFVRALCYFYLVRLFGDLPKVTNTEYEANAVLPRMPAEAINALIESDLDSAIKLLPRDFSTAFQEEHTLPTAFAAYALRARHALYRRQWSVAANAADSVVAQEAFFFLPPVEEAFNYNSPEAIWQIKRIDMVNGNGTWEADIYPGLEVILRPELVDAFEVDDLRLQWRGESVDELGETVYFPFKYRYPVVDYTQPELGLEYHIELRLAEQYLIRAEARAHLGDFDGAIADLDMVRGRAGLPALADMGIIWTLPLVLERVMQERRVELFSEGHRWFDLIRTEQADAVLGDIKKATWALTDTLLPVPQAEINKNRNLEPQNKGY